LHPVRRHLPARRCKSRQRPGTSPASAGQMGASGGKRSPCCSNRETTCFSKRAPREDAAHPRPVVVAISGAAGQIGYSLLPMIARGELFGPGRRVVLQCLDLSLPTVKDTMRGIEMELQDGNFELLHRVKFTTDDAEAFREADYAVLLGAFPLQEGREKREVMEKNNMIFRTIGHAISRYASRDCKVLVVGHPACTNALLCARHAPALPKENFFALTRLDQNRASGLLAQRAGVSVGDVRNVIIWGSHGRTPDLEHAEVQGQPVRQRFSKPEDAQWLRDDFIQETRQRGANIVKARRASSALSAARAIVNHIHDLHCGGRSGEMVSMGVWSDGNPYGVRPGLIFSMPVCCPGRGGFRFASGLQLSKESRSKISEAEQELLEDRSLAESILEKKSKNTAASTAPADAT